MADVTVEVAGRQYRLACDEGEEARLERLAGVIDQEARRLAARLRQPPGESRLLLMAALIVADRLHEASEQLEDANAELARLRESAAAPAGRAGDGQDLFQQEIDAGRAARIEAVAERIEALSRRLAEK
jgi:cell division protein ZapA